MFAAEVGLGRRRGWGSAVAIVSSIVLLALIATSSRADTTDVAVEEFSEALTEGGFINVRKPPFLAAGDGKADDTEAIQSAWDVAARTGARVLLPPGQYRISLRGDSKEGYRPALHFSANGVSKEKQPILEGATRSVTLLIDFPEDAPRTQEVILIDKGNLTDNPRGMQFRNLRLVNSSAPREGSWRDATDFRGVGLRIVDGWTGHLMQNFHIGGFYIGIDFQDGYHSEISHGEIRDCNFGLRLFGTPNGNTFRSIAIHRIRAAANNTEGLDPKLFPGERIGACVYAGGGTITGAYFESVNTELCSVAGYFFHSDPHSFTVASMRSESVYAPIWIHGPKAPFRTSACTFLSPSIDCDSLIAPAITLHRAEGYTFISPRFYQRDNENGSRTAIELTSASRGNSILNPVDDRSGTTGNLSDDVIDHGKNNLIRWSDSTGDVPVK